MKQKTGVLIVCTWPVLCALPAVCQETNPSGGPAPIYRVDVIERTVKAINYQYRSGRTGIDFRGTVLLPKAKGEAAVESRQGRTEIDAKFEKLDPPARFGREYLTYVLWAISPEGRPHNLGEIVSDSSNKGRLRVTTDMQAFGLIVTAEPYSAVRQPSDVVVLENQVRSDTVGKIEEIQAKYELMPRGHYTWQVPENLAPAATNAPKVSMGQYEALLELYQAQNAVGIARVANAERYAPNTFAKARQLLEEAQQLQARGSASRVVESAREAAQTAEDARVIAERRQQEEKLAQAQAEAAKAAQEKARAAAEVEQAKAEAHAARAQAEAERAARQRAETEAAAARERAAEAEAGRAKAPASGPPQPRDQQAARKTVSRMLLLEELNGVLATRDTPRGLVATVPDAGFNGAALRATAAEQVARISAIVAAHPGLRVEVEGHTDSAASTAAEALSWERARAVHDTLVRHGSPASVVSARGFGDSRPLVSNARASGREENRRVEIVISGDPIGKLPSWDRPYTLTLSSSSRP